MSLALLACLPFCGAVLAAAAGRFGRSAPAIAAGAVTALALGIVLVHAPCLLAGPPVAEGVDWLPQLGLNVRFRLDGLAFLFALLILGIGLLILLYARFYLEPQENPARFFCFLMLFQGAMLGIVLSDNLLFLLIFWEMTSLTSFLLIGWWSHLPEARRGARMALAITGGGGLALIAGMLLLGRIAGSYELSAILTKGEAIRASALYLPALLLILLGAFAKSAQFPFHFWLPQAMAAPTPVSAYLHSATMVKAGIYLLARLWPVLSGTEVWFCIVATTGLVTLLLGAKTALFRDDLKAVLASSTVSHLGLITFLLGLGTKAAALAAMVHILAHASFKAALFLLAGIVDHAAGTRDLRRLGGLRRLMPVSFALTLVAGLSMAGVPPLSGFLSKELMLEEAAHTLWAGTGGLVPVLAMVAAAASVAYSLRLIGATFLGTERADYPHPPHEAGPGLLAAPAVLVLLVIATGLMPMALLGPLAASATAAVTGEAGPVHLALWHGLEPPALWMSLAAFGGGLMVLGLYPTLRRWWDAFPKPDGPRLFEAALGALTGAARRVTRLTDSGSITQAMAIAVATILAAGLRAFSGGGFGPATRAMTPVEGAVLTGWGLLMAFTLGTVILHRNRLLAVLLVGGAGLMISAGFARLAAPDLALTQIAVEAVTVILLLLALTLLPQKTPRESLPLRRLRDGVLAGTAGIGAAALAYALLRREAAWEPISAFHLAQSTPGAGGTNAVNTIIVDFRGYDTFGEILVLGIAALILYALVEGILAAGILPKPLPGRRRAGDPHPEMLVVAMRVLLPLAMLVGIYIFLRGHNLPGGGFVAGLVFSIALTAQALAAGFDWMAGRRRVGDHALIGAGGLVALLCGAGAMFFGRPFLTSAHGHVTLWPLERFGLATAAIFDLGVFLCVLGAVMLALSSLTRLARVATGGRV